MGKVRENIIDISVHVKYSKVRDKCVGRKEILMGLDVFDNYECEGQMTIEDFLADIEVPESIFAVSKIFARARKQMNTQELKAFTYALTNLRFKEENGNKLLLDKKTLANIVGIHSDPDHLSQDLKRSIGQLPKNSFIEFEEKDKDFFESGVFITSLRMYKNNVGITFNPDYMPLFNNLQKDYITMWSGDIFGMSSERSMIFYEDLRLGTDTREDVCSKGFGIKALKELFNIPKDGKGSYMRKNGHFDRQAFERYVIEPLCEDMAKCKMIQLVVQENGKYYEKVKKGNRVLGYRFFWTFSAYPKVATASEVKKIQERVDKDPRVLKIAKDLVNSEKKKTTKKNEFNNFRNRKCSTKEKEDRYNKLLEKQLLGVKLSQEEQKEFNQLKAER